MKSVVEMDFVKLPASVRERFVACTEGLEDPDPILQNTFRFSFSIAGWALLAAAGVGILALVVSAGRTHTPLGVVACALGVALVAVSVAALVRRTLRRRVLPFDPGLYLFPMDLVDARGRTLKIVPMGSLRSIRGVHNFEGGVYCGTVLTFHFEDRSVSFVVHGRERAEHVVQEIGELTVEIDAVFEGSDLQGLRRLDPFFDLRSDVSSDGAYGGALGRSR